jgi:molybdate transport system substrate-binding protein
LAGCGGSPARREIKVAAASDLKFALDELAPAFERAHPGYAVRISTGSSGNFYAQITNGAPFDIYLSADIEYPKKLAASGIGIPGSLFVYATGRLALWVPAGSPLNPATALRDPNVNRLAIANPTHAPYGRAAEQALHSLGVYDSLKDKLVLGDNVAQTLAFVQSGAAQAGIVALSLAVSPTVRDKGRYWEIPTDAYPKLEQGGMLLKAGPGPEAFRAFIISRAGREILARYGFQTEDR